MVRRIPQAIGLVATSLAAVVTATAATAEDPGPGPQFSTTRDELVSKWDLNKDGRIDESEAELARSQMRRKRIEIMEQSRRATAVGPESRPSPGLPGQSPLQSPATEPTPNRPKPFDPIGDALAPKPPASAETSPTSDAGMNDARKEPATAPVKKSLNAGAARERTITTGGSRAGAPAIRPGYGAAGPKMDLNAGRLPGGLPASRGIQPGINAMPFRKPATAPQPAPRPTGATPGLFPQAAPRVSAEDFGSP